MIAIFSDLLPFFYQRFSYVSWENIARPLPRKFERGKFKPRSVNGNPGSFGNKCIKSFEKVSWDESIVLAFLRDANLGQCCILVEKIRDAIVNYREYKCYSFVYYFY